jgi:hypothetical protein
MAAADRLPPHPRNLPLHRQFSTGTTDPIEDIIIYGKVYFGLKEYLEENRPDIPNWNINLNDGGIYFNYEPDRNIHLTLHSPAIWFNLDDFGNILGDPYYQEDRMHIIIPRRIPINLYFDLRTNNLRFWINPDDYRYLNGDIWDLLNWLDDRMVELGLSRYYFDAIRDNQRSQILAQQRQEARAAQQIVAQQAQQAQAQAQAQQAQAQQAQAQQAPQSTGVSGIGPGGMDEERKYYEKYLKYKNKYLQFKNNANGKLNMVGGVNNSDIISFNNLSLDKALVIFYKEYSKIIGRPLIDNFKEYLSNYVFSLDDLNSPLFRNEEFKNTPILKLLYNKNIPVIKDVLPKNLIYLKFESFNLPLNVAYLPRTLKTLILGNGFNHPINLEDLPNSLEHLELSSDFNQPFNTYYLPRFLKYIALGNSNINLLALDNLPNLKSLIFPFNFEQNIEIHELPRKLEELYLGNFDDEFDTVDLPRNLIRLDFGNKFNAPLDIDRLPDNLKSLKFGFRMTFPIDTTLLPVDLEELYLGELFNDPVDASLLPRSLKVLYFGNSFNQEIVIAHLPRNLEKLDFGDSYEHEIKIEDLPRKLKVLKLGKLFNKNINAKDLPKTLEILYFKDDGILLETKELPKSLVMIKL